MPNLMNDIVSSSQTLSTIRQLRTDTSEIYRTVMKGSQSVENIVSDMSRSNNVFRSFQSWLKGSSDSLQSSYETLSDSEFDSNDDPETPSTILDSSSYKELKQAQTDAMYQIASKQLSAKISNAAEIISVVDHRSAEIVSSLTRTDDIVKQIAAKFDKLVQMDTAAVKQRQRQLNLLSANGGLSISNITNAIRERQRSQDSFVKQGMDYLKQKTRFGEIDNAVAAKINGFQDKLFRAIFSIPWIKKRFDPFGMRSIDTNYTKFIQNEYTKEPATFDGITRKTIVDIIPEYLRMITEGLTGKRYFVSNQGNLTQRTEHGFERLVETTFDMSTISEKSNTAVSRNISYHVHDISAADVREVQRALISQYVYRAYRTGRIIENSKFFQHGGERAIHLHVAQLLSKVKGKSVDKWMNVIDIISTEWIMNPKFAEEFTRAVNKGYRDLHQRAMQYAASSNGRERMVFTQEMFDRQIESRFGFKSEAFQYEGKTLRQLIRDKIVKKESLTADQLANLDKPIISYTEARDKLERMADESDLGPSGGGLARKFNYAESIFDILNRGINVYSRYGGKKGLDPTDPKENQPEEAPQPQQSYPELEYTSGKVPTLHPSVDVASFTPTPLQPVVHMVGGAVSRITDTISSMLNPNSDEEKTKETMAGMNAVIQSGEATDSDRADLNAKTSDIKNPSLRQRIQSTISGVFDRFSEKKPKSLLGRALLAVFGIAKSFFSKIFSAGKTFISKGISMMVKSMQSSLEKIRTGAQSIREGFKGSDDSIGIFGRVKGLFSRRRKKKRKSDDTIGALVGSGTIDAGDASNYNTYTMEEPSEEEELDEEEEKVVEEIVEEEKNPDKKKGSLFSTIADKFKRSGFGQGFSDAMAKKLPTKTPETVEDEASSQILDIMKQDSKTGMLSMCGDKLDVIHNTAGEWIDTEIQTITSETQSDDKGDQNDNQKQDTSEESGNEKQEKKSKGLGYDLGKIFGGATKILLGIGQAMATVVAGMSGFKAIMKLIKGVLEKSLKPLNKAFKTLYKALKPTVKTIQKVLKEIVQYIVEIVESVIKIIQPILEAIGPIIDQLLEVLNPILDMITQLLNVLMVPLVAIMQSVIVPLLQTTANALEILLGITQVGFGLILTALGGLISVVGTIAAFFSGNKSMKESGDRMVTLGKQMMESGANSVVSGFKKTVQLIGNTFKGVTSHQAVKTVASAARSTSKQYSAPSGSAMEGLYGSGDYDQPYKFDDDVQDALETLKDLTSQIISMFTFEDDGSVESKLNAEQNRLDEQQIRLDVSNMSEAEQQAIDDAAFEFFKAENPQYEGETDAEYRARYEQNKTEYWMMAATDAVRNKVNATSGGTDNGAVSIINTALGEIDPTTGERTGGFIDTYAQDMKDRIDSVTSSGLSGSVTSMLFGNNGSTGSYGGTTSGYDKEDLIRTEAMLYEGYLNYNPAGTYSHGFTGPIKLRNGVSLTIRPDCSGFVSAAIREMGYTLKDGKEALQSQAFANANSNTLIYDPNGSLSSDWQVLPYSKDKLESGDITALPGHVGMPITNLTDSFPKGLDGGKTESIVASAKAATAYLNGEPNVSWRSTLGWGKWNENGGATKIWRYVGKPIQQTTGSTSGSTMMSANPSAEQIFNYLVNSVGMTPTGAAGLMGCFYYESAMRPNNLENKFEQRYGTTDEKYTAAVDSKAESEHNFVHGRTSSESEKVGYGLAQFTSSNLKQDLYDRTVKQGKSIADAPTQLDAIASMLQKRGLFSQINNAANPTEANKIFLWKYEAGTSYTSDARVLAAYPWMDKRTDGYANAVVARHQKAEEYYRLYGSGDEPYIDSIYDEDGGISIPAIIPDIPKNVEIPDIDPSKFEQQEDEKHPIIVNRVDIVGLESLSDYIDEILVTDYDIEATEIKKLVEDIFEELPEYLEDDDDDDDYEFDEMDDMMIQRLAAAFM